MGKSPFLLPAPARAKQLASREVLLFFMGTLCWSLTGEGPAATLDALLAKCNRSDVPAYSFGHRLGIFLQHRAVLGFRLLASDLSSTLPPGGVDTEAEMLRARFCLAPSGTGWGTRTTVAAVLGCIPVIVQHDGVNEPVVQPFEAAQLLPWRDFSVVVRAEEVARLPEVLARVDVRAKQAALQRAWGRFVWSEALPPADDARLVRAAAGPHAFETAMAALQLRSKGPF